MIKKSVDPREAAARALCRRDNNPENTTFEGKPMWMSYLDTVDLVLEAAIPQSIEATALRMTELILAEKQKTTIHFSPDKEWIFKTYEECLATIRKKP